MSRQKSLEQLFNIMFQLRSLISQKIDVHQEEKAATILQFSALNYMKQNKKIQVSELSNFLHLSKSSTTQLIERLEKTDYVQREHDQNDRRIIHLLLTRNGEKNIEIHKKKIVRKLQSVFKDIPDSDIENLIRIHSNIRQTLEESKK